MGNSNSGILRTLFSLLFKSKRGGVWRAVYNEPEPAQEHHPLGSGFAAMFLTGKFDETFIERIEQLIERSSGHGITPQMADQILNSDFFQQKLDASSQARIRQALAKATGHTSTAEPPAPIGLSPASPTLSPTSAWEPDALTHSDADWKPDTSITGEDPWRPGSKSADPWHPDTGTKKNDPWHPSD